ncbi:hypothetical protein D9758_002541 [Tetrapyrgos nigripes]|uniref:Ferritin-like domain-containing protein n=1 Tax=Tetrapyrgos nigripes TaxID=182062 RepID=A0A8H5GQF2_9AGAR|nr:hypothetical protein D9758_002541 [Tetrapyrgos nigripes]
MRYSTLLSFTLPLFAAAGAHIVVRQTGGEDIDPAVLNFALTLEHLENAFYSHALSAYDAGAFQDAGYAPWVRGRIQEISAHEQAHVDFLTSALQAAGATPAQACTYNFTYTDPKSFIQLSSAFETVGTSAYTGAASLITNKDYLTAAGTILVTEARHSSWIDSSGKHQNPWSGAFEVALTPNQVYTIASAFIESCPSSNPALPAKANPALSISADAAPGQNVSLTFDATAAGNSSDGLYLNILTSSGSKSAPISVDGDSKTATFPDVIGTVFAFVTDGSATVTDNNTVAGPALLMFPFDSQGELIH